jgi:signal transduction histidine kinase
MRPSIIDMTTSDQLLSLGQFLRARQADILAAWNSAIRETWPHRPDGMRRGAVTARLLDHIIAAVERPPAVEAFPAIGGDRGVQTGTTARQIAIELSLLRRVILRRLRERSSMSAAEYELLWVAFETALADAFAADRESDEESNEALADTSGADAQRTASERRDRFLDEASRTDLAGLAATAIDNARLYDDARRALQAREEILAIVTHDLRTPLAAVMTAACLLATADAEDPDAGRIRQRAETIQRATRHMSRLVRDLGDLAQIDAGRLAIEKEVVDPVRLVREAVETLEPVVRKGGGTLRCEVGAEVPGVECDRERIVQVISNLVGNASKAGANSITVNVEPRQGELVVSVADTGPGIAAEDLPHMFDRYWRGRNANYRGTGLGLPISYGIVKAHGGHMWVESTVGAGSTVYFSIPR